MPPTPALPFLLQEKEAKAYLRGFPLDIPNQLYKDDAPFSGFYTSASTLSKSAK